MPNLISARYEGVFYRESVRRKHQNRPDRTYAVCWSNQGKKFWKLIGRASLGVTAEGAYLARLEILRRLRNGLPPVPPDPTLTVSQAVEAYITWAEAEGQNIQPRRRYNESWLTPRIGDVPLNLLDSETLDRLKAGMTSLAPNTRRIIFALLQASINHAIKRRRWQGVNPISPAGGYRLPPEGEKCERFLTPEEARKLLDELATRAPIWHDMALVSLHTGARLTELLKMRGRDIDESRQLVIVNGKSGEREVIHLTPESLAALLRQRREPNEPVFRRTENGEPFIRTAWIFKQVVRDCGLNAGVSDNRHKVWFHTLRHTFASWLAQSGVDIYAIMKLLRHRKIEMTQRYAHLLPDRQREHLRVIREMFTAER